MVTKLFKFFLFIPAALVRWMANSAIRNTQNILTAIVQIWLNKGRSILTTLGVIIAVTSTITVVSFVQGFSNFMTQKVRGYGTQYMIVRPIEWWETPEEKRSRVTLDLADVEAVRTECTHIQRITPFLFINNAEVSYGLEKVKDVPIRGVGQDYQVIRNYYADAGRFLSPLDVENAAKVIVLGRTVLKHLQCDESIIGQYVHMLDDRFLVIGILEAKGGMMGEDQDMTVMIPYTVAQRLDPNLRESVRFLAEATNEAAIPEAEGQIRRLLRQRHGLRADQPDDFRINRQDQALKEFENIRNIASGVLAGIVSISLLVGGIGIMNVMLVSVSERTREIGLRKSIGGRRRDIMMQFLTEAVVLCTLGGCVGVILGYIVTYIASLHPSMVPIQVPLWSVALALGFSAGAGVFFGIIPAFKAAILHPIEALRHE